MPSKMDLTTLGISLSNASYRTSDSESWFFQKHHKRWSNIDLKTPAEILLPGTEEDCVKIVQWALGTKTPFVCKSGGMSLYSTIGKEGIVIDLSELSAIEHDTERNQATLIGAISTKTVAVELADHGNCTTLPSANPVGAIPFFLNGGNSPLVSKLGYASDNIVSARVITADGELITVSEVENADLLSAIRGAGQYFGLVISLTVRTFPLSEVFGNDTGHYWSGRFIFPLDRVNEVSEAMEPIINNPDHCAGGLVMVAAAPPTMKPAIAVMAKLIDPGSDTLQETVFKPLYDLKPMAAAGGMLRIENAADALEILSAPGDFKKLRLTGIHTYDKAILPQVVDVWKDLVAKCPEALGSYFAIQWESQPPLHPKFASANSMHDVRMWANNMIWCKKPESVETAQMHLEEAIKKTRMDLPPVDFVDFANSVREPESPVEWRYKGSERLGRLRELKRKWDPNGVFSKEFL